MRVSGVRASGLGVEVGEEVTLPVRDPERVVLRQVAELSAVLVHELSGWAFDMVVADLVAGGDGTERGVDLDVLDGVDGLGVRFRPGLRQVEAGDLEAVEKQAGAARVDVVGGDALQDFADGVLDGAAVFGVGQREDGAAAASRFGVLYRLAGGVMVVAKFFLAQARASAAAAVDEDMAAAEALWLGFGFGFKVDHAVLPSPGVFCCKCSFHGA